MATTTDLNPNDPAVLALVREWATSALSKIAGAELKPDPKGAWLVNPVSGATYNICAVGGAEAKSGMHCLIFDSKMNPAHGVYGAVWLAMVDLAASEVHVINAEHWHRSMDKVFAVPASSKGNIIIQTEQGWHFVWFKAPWAKQAGLVAKSQALTGKDSFAAFYKKSTTSSENFCHLHVHSMFSLLDGVSDVADIPKRAAEIGQPGIALTDHGYMFGVYKFFNACKAAGVKPLIGCEFYVVDDVKQRYIDTAGTTRRFEYHQTVLAMNPQGWENLCKLGSMACKHQYYYVPRIDRSQLLLHNDGLIVLSGCFKGTVAWHLMQHDPEVTRLQPWCCRSLERSRKIMQEYHAVYGDRYFIECQHIDGFDQYNAIMPELIGMARDEGVKCVVTNDCHYEREEDAVLQALMSRISKDGVGDGVGGKFAQKGSLFIKRRAEIVNPNFTPDMFDNTVEIMNRCDVDLSFKGYMFPEYPLEQDPDWRGFQEPQVVRPTRNVDVCPTSREALEKLRASGKQGTDQAFTIECVMKSPGETSDALEDKYCPDDKGTIWKRLSECEAMGAVYSDGTSTNLKGHNAKRWWPGRRDAVALAIANEGNTHE